MCISKRSELYFVRYNILRYIIRVFVTLFIFKYKVTYSFPSISYTVKIRFRDIRVLRQLSTHMFAAVSASPRKRPIHGLYKLNLFA